MLWGTLLLLRRSRRRRLLHSCATFPDRENNGCFLDIEAYQHCVQNQSRFELRYERCKIILYPSFDIFVF